MDITALIAGVFGGFLGTMIVNYFTKDLDFKYDYKRYILKKRQEAYDEVEKIMMDLGSEGTDDFYNSIPAIFSTGDIFWEFQNKIANTIIKYKVWLSDVRHEPWIWELFRLYLNVSIKVRYRYKVYRSITFD